MRASKRAVRSFNPRVLAGGRDLRFSALLWYVCRFNPRVLAGGRDRSFRTSRKIIASFQSTRPRGRTRRPDCGYEFPREVSIHASSREDATSLDVSAGASGIVSIHASSREDATVPARLQSPEIGFNPRVLAGGRDPAFLSRFAHSFVSIHASSREDATRFMLRAMPLMMFQSTRPRGRTRLSGSANLSVKGGFNPRVLAGGRDLMLRVPWSTIMFQSTRPRGRTRLYNLLIARYLHVSIHASSREDATLPFDIH